MIVNDLKKRLDTLTPSDEELSKLVKERTPPASWWDEDDPFEPEMLDRLKSLTPSIEGLDQRAKKYPPPAWWWNDNDNPFEPENQS